MMNFYGFLWMLYLTELQVKCIMKNFAYLCLLETVAEGERCPPRASCFSKSLLWYYDSYMYADNVWCYYHKAHIIDILENLVLLRGPFFLVFYQGLILTLFFLISFS